ncbi:type II toxin-antitoxin system RelE/ParE family toxin [Brevundimonas sp.]
MAEHAWSRSGLTRLSLAITEAAQRDIEDLIAFSRRRFGELRADRYQALLLAALLDLRDDPDRPGVRCDDRLQEGIRLFHMRSVSRPVTGVRSPRHWIVFRVRGPQLRVMRVLHEKMDLVAHLL